MARTGDRDCVLWRCDLRRDLKLLGQNANVSPAQRRTSRGCLLSGCSEMSRAGRAAPRPVSANRYVRAAACGSRWAKQAAAHTGGASSLDSQKRTLPTTVRASRTRAVRRRRCPAMDTSASLILNGVRGHQRVPRKREKPCFRNHAETQHHGVHAKSPHQRNQPDPGCSSRTAPNVMEIRPVNVSSQVPGFHR
jgi:hypothetical protein